MKRLLWFLAAMIAMSSQPAWPNASSFNGTTSIITGVDSASLESTSMTVGGWFYRDSADADNGGELINKHDSGGTGWALYSFVADVGFVAFFSVNLGEWTWAVWTNNTWHHICATYNGTATTNDPVLHFNGVQQGAPTEASTPAGTWTVADASSYRIGSDDGLGFVTQGRAGSIFYYNRILSNQECKSIMRFGPQAVPNGLILNLPLGSFAARNYTSTTGLAGTESNITLDTSGPPISAAPGGRWE